MIGLIQKPFGTTIFPAPKGRMPGKGGGPDDGIIRQKKRFVCPHLPTCSPYWQCSRGNSVFKPLQSPQFPLFGYLGLAGHLQCKQSTAWLWHRISQSFSLIEPSSHIINRNSGTSVSESCTT